jgi:hypothetical protein
MKKLLLLACILSLTRIASAQTLSPEVIGSSGGHYISGNSQLSWTVGEAVINTHSTGNIKLTQGFHQPYNNVSAVDNLSSGAIYVIVFPNPTADLIALQLSSFGNYSIQIFDILGRNLENKKVENSNLIEFNLSEYAAGNYLMRICSEDNALIQTLEIQKIR